MLSALLSAGDYTSNYWYLRLYYSGAYATFYSATTLSDGSIIAGASRVFFSPFAYQTLVRLTPKGRVTWYREGEGGWIENVHAASDGSILIVAPNGPGIADTIDIQKRSAEDGSITTQRDYDPGTERFRSDIDGSDNLYVGGDILSGSYNHAYVAKTTVGSGVAWDRKLGNTSASASFKAFAVDGSGNVYACGDYASGGYAEGLLAKYNSSGTIQWHRRIHETNVNLTPVGCDTDSSGNVYLTTGATVMKYNSSGTLQWQYKIASGVSFKVLKIIDDRVFLGGQSTYGALIMECNTSGAIQWQTEFSPVGASTAGIALDGTALVAAIGTGILRVPADGSKTGTYGSDTYQTASWSFVSGTHTSATGALTDAAVTMTESTTAYSTATASPTLARTVFRP